MLMSRVSKNLGFTVPPAMVDEFERVAREERSTKSELFRRMFRFYQSYRTPLKARSDTPDAWVERLILEAQAEERRTPLSAEAFAAEIEGAQHYGAERVQALGLATEEQLNERLYEDRREAAHRP